MYYFKLNNYQIKKLQEAHKKNTNATFQITSDKIFKGENIYYLDKIQLEKLKKAKEKKSGTRLEIRNSQIKDKKGGFLPLIFAGIGAASALVGGVTSIVNSVNDYKHKKAVEKETIRHNKAMENKGSGLKKKKIEKMNNFIKSSFMKNLKKKNLNIEPLSNFDIIQFGHNIKIFRGCFMRDELPLKPWLNECGILNLNNSTQEGSHWVAWKKIKNKKIYFDSFGMSPPPELVKYLGEDNLKWSDDKIQDYDDPPICGHLCLEFIKNYKKCI